MNDQIRQRAFQIWEQDGRPEGKHEQHWQRASEELSARDNGAASENPGTALQAEGSAGADANRGGKIARATAGKRKRA